MRLFFPLSGDDIFISYSHKDGPLYAAGLADKLTEKNLSCFIDKLGTEPNHELPLSLKKKIKKCTILVIVGTEKAAQSEFVKKEIAEFRQTKRTILPVDFDGNVGKAIWYEEIPGIAVENENDLQALKTGDPSQNVINFIEKSFNYTRRNQYMFRMFWGALVLFLGLVGVSMGAAYYASTKIDEAKEASKKAEEQTKKADQAEKRAVNQENIAKAQEAEAIKQNENARLAKQDAIKQTEIAKIEKGKADESGKLADEKNKLAIEKTKIADEATLRASDERQKADEAKKQANEARENERNANVRADNSKRATYIELGRQYLNNNYPFRAAIYLSEAYKMSPQNEDSGKMSSIRFLLGLSMKSVESLRFSKEYKDENVVYAKFSPNSEQIAIAGADNNPKTENTVRVLNTETGEEVISPIQHGYDVNTSEFSSDGRKIITSSDDHTARLFDLEKRELSFIFPHNNDVKSAKFSPDDNQIATIDSDDVATVWDIRTREKIFSKKIEKIISTKQKEKYVGKVEFSPNIKQIVIADYDENYDGEIHGVTIYDIKTGEAVRCFEHKGLINTAKFSPDGLRIVTASNDKTVKIFDLKTKKVIATLQHQNSVLFANFSPDNKRILTITSSYTASVWDIETQKPITSVQHYSAINSASFSPNGKQIVTASNDRTAKIWDAETGSLLVSMEHYAFVVLAEYSPDGKKIVTSGNDRKVKIWDVGAIVNIPKALHQHNVISARFSTNNERIVTASWDNTAKILDIKTGKITTLMMKGCSVYSKESLEKTKQSEQSLCHVRSANFSTYDTKVVTASNNAANIWDAKTGILITSLTQSKLVVSAEFSPDDRYIVTAGYDGTAKVWDIANSEKPVAVFEHSGNVNSAKFSHNGKLIVTASDDGTAKVWDIANPEKPIAVVTHKNNNNDYVVFSAEFSPNDKQIVTASRDKTAKVWDIETNKQVASFDHTEPITSAEFSPDGSKIVTGSQDNTAKVWDIANPGKSIVLDHQNRVRSAKFSPNGKQIVTASDDGTAKVWEVETGDLLVSIEHQGRVRFAEFSPDGRQIVTSSFDNTAKVWSFSPEVRDPKIIERIIEEKVPFRIENLFAD